MEPHKYFDSVFGLSSPKLDDTPQLQDELLYLSGALNVMQNRGNTGHFYKLSNWGKTRKGSSGMTVALKRNVGYGQKSLLKVKEKEIEVETLEVVRESTPPPLEEP